jgi:hypothetical protein
MSVVEKGGVVYPPAALRVWGHGRRLEASVFGSGLVALGTPQGSG